jgi:polysaccharide biosynthesis transport protein
MRITNRSDRDEFTEDSQQLGAEQNALDGPDLSEGKDLGDYLRALYKRRWIAAAVFVVVATAMLLRTANDVPIFDARVQLLIDAEAPNVLSFSEVIADAQARYDYAFTETQHKLLTSRTLARKTIDALHLWQHPYLGSDASNQPPPSVGLIGTVTKRFTAFLGFGAPAPTSNAEPPAPGESVGESRAIDTFLSGLVVAPLKNSRLVDVVYRSPDPAFATTVVNELARQYIQQNLDLRFRVSKDASDWLEQQLAQQRQQVEKSELALQRFREQNDAVSLEEHQNIVVQKLADLNGAVTEVKNERIAKETSYERLRAIVDDVAALDAFPAVLSNTFIQELKSELSQLQQKQSQLSEALGDKHPEMIKARAAVANAEQKLKTEIRNVVESVKNEYLTAVAREKTLVKALNAQKGEALSQNRKAIAYGALQRDAASNRQIYESLLQRLKETDLSEELRATNVRIVDVAELPRTPIGANRRTELLFAILVGAVVAIGLVFGLDYIDNRITSADEMTGQLGIPCLGLVPAAQRQSDGAPLINSGATAHFSEAFRTIRTNVVFSSIGDGCRTIVITSTSAGEGKTVVTSNLALALAQANQRVLVIDADLRRPQMHNYLSAAQEPGLSNYIVGNSTAAEVQHETGVSGLTLLPCGRIPPNPAELLGSSRFKDFLSSMREHFDWIVIDSPPVMAVTDACLVAHLADGVLFVVGSEMTNRKAARRAVRQLQLARAGFIGGILNRVDLQQGGYYYSSYYGRNAARYHADVQPQE